MDTPIIDHRGPEFQKLARRCLDGIKTIFKTANPVIIYTATGTGAWEAALVNTLNAGDRVLMVETGQFGTLWKKMAESIGLKPEFIATDWRIGAEPSAIEDALRKDSKKEIKAVCVLHNETSTGCLSPIAEIRKAIDAAGHPALFMVDTISSLASTDYRHDEWGVDVTVGGAQKGLMLPPGMSFNAISDKALDASRTSKMPKSFWAWDDMLAMNKIGFFPYTPATQMLHGLATGIDMLHEEGLDNVFARHDRLAEATRRAVRAWGLEILCRDPKFYSPTITAVMVPDGHDADAFRNLALDTFNISYGTSFGKYAGKYFRIGHLGDINETQHDRRAGRDRDGAVARRHPAQEGRRAGGDGLSRVGTGRCGQGGGGVAVTTFRRASWRAKRRLSHQPSALPLVAELAPVQIRDRGIVKHRYQRAVRADLQALCNELPFPQVAGIELEHIDPAVGAGPRRHIDGLRCKAEHAQPQRHGRGGTGAIDLEPALLGLAGIPGFAIACHRHVDTGERPVLRIHDNDVVGVAFFQALEAKRRKPVVGKAVDDDFALRQFPRAFGPLVVGSVGQEVFELAAGRKPEAGAHFHHADQAIGPDHLGPLLRPHGRRKQKRRDNEAAHRSSRKLAKQLANLHARSIWPGEVEPMMVAMQASGAANVACCAAWYKVTLAGFPGPGSGTDDTRQVRTCADRRVVVR